MNPLDQDQPCERAAIYFGGLPSPLAGQCRRMAATRAFRLGCARAALMPPHDGGRTMRLVVLGLVLAAGCALTGTQRCMAEGAIAVALPKDVAKDGFAYGTGYKFATTAEAQAKALERCQQTKSELRRKLCKVVNTFNDRCIAVAMDPADGTPGVGWAIEADLKSAERVALEKCEATAGPGRHAACKVHSSGCDGAAK
jgi:hypothetical protein